MCVVFAATYRYFTCGNRGPASMGGFQRADPPRCFCRRPMAQGWDVVPALLVSFSGYGVGVASAVVGGATCTPPALAGPSPPLRTPPLRNGGKHAESTSSKVNSVFA